jgi:hypothetical protein
VHRFRCTEERELEDLSSSPSSSLFLKNEKSENAEEDALTIVVPPLTALLFFRVVGTLDDASLEDDGSVARIILCACVYGERAQARALFFGVKV